MPGPPTFGRLLSELNIARKSESSDDLEHLTNLLSSTKRTDKMGFPLTSTHKGSITRLISLLVGPEDSVRKEALLLLNQCYNYEALPNGPPLDILDTLDVEKIEKNTFPALLNLLKKTGDTVALECWDIIINILGKHLHTKTSLVNSGMRVVQHAFKMPEPRMMEKALRSWVILMQNFALAPEILNSPRRIKLLVMALKYNPQRQHESTYRVRLDCWMELMHLLGKNLQFHDVDLVQEFLMFCYGPKSCTEDRTSSPARIAAFNTPTKPMSPVKKFASLEKVCLDALVQLFAPRPLQQGLPRPSFSKQLSDVAITPSQFGKMSEIILHALEHVTDNLKASNRSEVLKVSCVWQGISNLARELTNLENHVQPIVNYLKSINHVSKSLRRQDKLHAFLFELLESVLRLPDTVLLSHIFSQSAFERKVSPLFLVFTILLQEPILNSKEETKALQGVLDKSSAKVADHGEMIEVLQRMEMATPELTFIGLDNLGVVWQCLCRRVSSFNELGETKALAKSFTAVMQFLRFPLLFLGERERKFWRDWENLYTNLSVEGEMTVGYECGQICAEMTERIVSVYKEQEMKPAALNGQLICLKIMIDRMIFSGIARDLKKSDEEPLSVFKRSHVNPLGQVTKTIQHLNNLSEKSVDTGDAEVCETLLDCYSSLFTRMDQNELVQPLLKLTLPKICQLLTEQNLARFDSAGLNDVMMKLFQCLTSFLENRFNHAKDPKQLEDLEEFFILCFESKRSKIKSKISEVWTVTFSGLESNLLPNKLKNVLRKCAAPGIKSQVSSDSMSGETNSFPNSSELLGNVIITEPAIEAALKSGNQPGTPMKNTRLASRNSPFKQDLTFKSPSKKTPEGSKAQQGRRRSTAPRLEDEDSCNFVKIQPKPKGKRILTEHQKDLMTSRKDDIPALYSELSREDSIIQLPSQFLTQPSLDSSMNSNDAILSSLVKQSVQLDEKAGEGSKHADAEKVTEVAEKPEAAPSKPEEKILDEFKADGGEDSNSEAEEVSPSQNLHDKAKADLKLRKNRRFEPESGSSGKRKRVSLGENTSVKQVRKRTKRELAKEIFGDSQSSQSESEEKAEPTETKEDTKIIEIHDDDKKEEIKPSQDSAQLLPTETKEAGKLDETMDSITSNSSSIEMDTQQRSSVDEDEVIGSSQDSLEDSRGPTRRSRRSTITKHNKQEEAQTKSVKPKEEGIHGKRNKFGETLLHQATKKGDVEKVKELLDQGACPDQPDFAGWFPIHEVSISKKKDAVKILNLLIKSGCRVNCEMEGLTPLHEAVTAGHLRQVEILLKAGADPELRTLKGERAIDLISKDTKIYEILVKCSKVEEAEISVDSAPKVIPESQEGDWVTPSRLVADLDVDLQSHTSHTKETGPDVSALSEQQKSLPENNDKSNQNDLDIKTTEGNEQQRKLPEGSEKQCQLPEENEQQNQLSEGSEQQSQLPEENKQGNHLPEESEQQSRLKEGSDQPTKLPVEIEEKSELPEGSDQSSKLPEGSEQPIKQPEGDDQPTKQPEMNEQPIKQPERNEQPSKLPEVGEQSSKLSEGGEQPNKLSPESNKENQVENQSPLMQLRRSPVPNRSGKVGGLTRRHSMLDGNSRAAKIVNLSRKKSLESMGITDTSSKQLNSPAESPNFSAPWAKYSPSPSHASPSAGILKRKKMEDTPSSTEGSPVSGKRRVHFHENPVSDSVVIPRIPPGKMSRKKLKLGGFDQELFTSREHAEEQDSCRVYQETPPLDVSPAAIEPELVDCDLPVKEVTHLLVPHKQWIQVLENDLQANCILTVGNLASLQPAEIRNIKGIKPMADKTVRSVLRSLASRLKRTKNAALKKKSPVIEITSQEEEDKIKEALFLGPSPSPTSPNKVDFISTSPAKDSAPEAEKESGRGPAPELEKESGRGTAPELEKESGRGTAPELEKEPGRETAQELEKEPGRKSAREPEKESGKESAPEPEKESGKETAPEPEKLSETEAASKSETFTEEVSNDTAKTKTGEDIEKKVEDMEVDDPWGYLDKEEETLADRVNRLKGEQKPRQQLDIEEKVIDNEAKIPAEKTEETDNVSTNVDTAADNIETVKVVGSGKEDDIEASVPMEAILEKITDSDDANDHSIGVAADAEETSVEKLSIDQILERYGDSDLQHVSQADLKLMLRTALTNNKKISEFLCKVVAAISGADEKSG